MGCGVWCLIGPETSGYGSVVFNFGYMFHITAFGGDPVLQQFTGNLGKSGPQGEEFHGGWCLEMAPGTPVC